MSAVAVVAVVNGAGTPGGTTSTMALALGWPAGVVLVDCDPLGGDIELGWCRPRLGRGQLDPDVGVTSFVQATRTGVPATAKGLAPYLQVPARAPHVELLLGVQSLMPGSRVEQAGWAQVAAALVDTSGSPTVAEPAGRDVLVDCGRLGPGAPWPVAESADLVLLVAGPSPRQVRAARRGWTELAKRVPARRLALLVCAADPADTTTLIGGVVPVAELPADRVAATLLIGEVGRSWRRFECTRLGRAARRMSRRLHRRLRTHYADDGDAVLRSRPVGDL